MRLNEQGCKILKKYAINFSQKEKYILYARQVICKKNLEQKI